MDNYIQLIVLIFAALAVLIPLGVKLYRTSRDLVREKNWPRLVAALSKYMEEAERLFEKGADRRVWVLSMIQSTAEQLDYTLTEADMKNLGDLIDTLIEMTKVVNVNGNEEEEAAE